MFDELDDFDFNQSLQSAMWDAANPEYSEDDDEDEFLSGYIHLSKDDR